MRPDPEMIAVLIDTAKSLKGRPKRRFMARAVKALGRGGPRWAEEHLGWSRVTIRKGMRELHSGMTCRDALSARGRRPVEGRLPRLLDDLRDRAEGQSQADPRFPTDRLFTPIRAAEVRRPWIAARGDTDAELPTPQTLNTKRTLLGFRLTRVAKCRPPKASRRPTLSSSN